MISDLTSCVKPHLIIQFLETVVNGEVDTLKDDARRMLDGINNTLDISDNPDQFINIALSSCAAVFNTSPEEIMSRKRNSNIIDAKRSYMWILKTTLGCTHRLVSETLKMHHSSVIHHLNTVDNYLMYNADFRAKINQVVIDLKQIGYHVPSEQFVKYVNKAEQKKIRIREKQKRNRV